jgi:GDP-4-dehydro-6-deoxy-D-mannose reductase
MRVLVTGANGFAGGHLCAALEARGHTVFKAGHARDKNYDQLLALDLLDIKNIAGIVAQTKPDAIAHLAAQAFVPASLADPLDTYATNAGGTARLLEVVREVDRSRQISTRVLVVGSADVYGRQPLSAFPLTESCAPNPTNPYAASKVAAEAFGLAAAQSYGSEVVMSRAFNHIGPGQDERFVVASFALQIARIAAGDKPLLQVGNLEAQRDFLDVRDVAAAYTLLLEKRGDAGAIYNIASSTAVPIREVLRRLIMISRVAVEIHDDPDLMRPSDIQLSLGSAAKLQAATGWAPTYSLDASLRDIYADARERVAASSGANVAGR